MYNKITTLPFQSSGVMKQYFFRWYCHQSCLSDTAAQFETDTMSCPGMVEKMAVEKWGAFWWCALWTVSLCTLYECFLDLLELSLQRCCLFDCMASCFTEDCLNRSLQVPSSDVSFYTYTREHACCFWLSLLPPRKTVISFNCCGCSIM